MMNPGDRVWHEPEVGIRFACTVVRAAKAPGRVIVEMVRPIGPDTIWPRPVPFAAPISSLVPRDEDYGELEPWDCEELEPGGCGDNDNA